VYSHTATAGLSGHCARVVCGCTGIKVLSTYVTEGSLTPDAFCAASRAVCGKNDATYRTMPHRNAAHPVWTNLYTHVPATRR